MSDCGVCLSVDFDSELEFSNVRIRKARKEYRCCECRRQIGLGERYEYALGKNDGEFWTEKTCLVCAEIANAFYCEGRMFGGVLWDDMDEVLLDLNTSCFDKLTTPEAKVELRRRWMVKKGLAA